MPSFLSAVFFNFFHFLLGFLFADYFCFLMGWNGFVPQIHFFFTEIFWSLYLIPLFTHPCLVSYDILCSYCKNIKLAERTCVFLGETTMDHGTRPRRSLVVDGININAEVNARCSCSSNLNRLINDILHTGFDDIVDMKFLSCSGGHPLRIFSKSIFIYNIHCCTAVCPDLFQKKYS